jgi:hypothetical protein
MNFEDAILAHSEWKSKLRNYISKKDNSLNPSILEQDNQFVFTFDSFF